MQSFKKIFEKLGLTKKNGLFILAEDEWQTRCAFSKRVEHLISDVIKPDAFFYFNKTPFILFFDNPENIQQLHQQIWNFNQSPVIFIRIENQYHIYNGFSFVKEKTGLAKLADFQEDLNDFNYFKIVTGETWEDYQDALKGKQRVDYKLLENVKTLRKLLIRESKGGLPSHIANNLIGRVLFIRYLIDRKVRIKKKLWTNEDLCKLLSGGVDTTYELFEYLQSKDNYNGDLFPIEEGERKEVEEHHLQRIVELLKGTNLESGQQSLFDIYDFSIIPVELISNVYEFFIGKKNQQSQGAYYTPLFLVDYVLSQTVESHFAKHQDSHSCKVLDPSCGSGIFLVESLRKIIWRFKSLNKGCENNMPKYQAQLRELIKDNIFGIDIDKEAVNVAIFSLYITLLDFIDKPADIEGFKFPNVLNENFFVSDFFNPKLKQLLEGKSFDFIFGNPPWGKGEGESKLFKTYWKKREVDESKRLKQETGDKKLKVNIKVSNEEISEAFMIRVSDFAGTNTRISFIIKSKIFYKSNTKDFRAYFLNKFSINSFLELSSVRQKIFDKSNKSAVHPAAIIFYHYAPQHDKSNPITHISLKPNRFFDLFKLLVIEKFDVKTVPQHWFVEHDWLWKTLVYGNILDFHLVRRLKNGKQTVKDAFNMSIGFQRGNRKNDHPETFNLKIFDYKKKSKLSQFQLFVPKDSLNLDTKFERIRDLNFYLKEKLVVSQAFNGELVHSFIDKEQILFPKSFACLLPKKNQKKEVVQFYLSTILFNYWLVCTSSYYGIEREIFLMNELENFPIPTRVLTTKNLSAFRDFKSKIIDADNIFSKVQSNHLVEKKELDEIIFDVYNLSEQDKDIISYAQDISIPSIQRKSKYEYSRTIQLAPKGKSYLQSYASIIAEHFDHLFKKAEKKIQVNIYHSKYTIGIEFCVVDIDDKGSKYQFITNKDTTDILNKFALLSFEKLSDELFIQKDIKGFEAESFYVVKPNEYKCWHRAIGHLDLGEILQATIKAGAQQKRQKENVQ